MEGEEAMIHDRAQEWIPYPMHQRSQDSGIDHPPVCEFKVSEGPPHYYGLSADEKGLILLYSFPALLFVAIVVLGILGAILS